jgi:hypothetical protein
VRLASAVFSAAWLNHVRPADTPRLEKPVRDHLLHTPHGFSVAEHIFVAINNGKE